jgi:hypothetical protein
LRVILALAAIGLCVTAPTAPGADSCASLEGTLEEAAWFGAWGCPHLIPDPQARAASRQPLRLATDPILHRPIGQALRLQLSNAFGGTPLHLLVVHRACPVGRPTDPSDPPSDRAVLSDVRGAVLILADAGYIKGVAPDLHIAVGSSGALQHLAGTTDPRVIFAIHTEPDSPIFGRVHCGLVGDTAPCSCALITAAGKVGR